MLPYRVHRFATTYRKYAPNRESTFMRVWVKQGKAAWPLVGILALVVGLMGAFAWHSLSNPDIHLNREERRSLDRIMSDQGNKATTWADSVFHRGPQFAQKKDNNSVE
ncbi:hypothetical protein BASA82_000413 [Batrachochytrium salamandrivorans]|nr:hypothetical protein BASA81_003206 [Batrachochytrium salamandrivorans]KAH9262547.1 hypothetical protein BASA82_000413 [Batrachochytrium salamandrivorans]